MNNFGKSVATQSKKNAQTVELSYTAAFAIITAVALKASRAVIKGFTDMIGVFAKFQQSLANTQSVARASTEELNDMEAAARRVGATTRSTASAAANALYFLASAGLSAAESIAALDGVNALAIATGSDLARTTETVVTVLKQYNLQSEESVRIANVFTAAITNSLATMNKLTKSFEYLGPIAAGLGLTVEETTGALQLLYNKGFSGEKAGRGLRTILINLADSTSVVNRKLSKLGITFNEVNPTVNSLADIFDTLRDKGVDATNAAAIFGKVSGVQLAALVSSASTAKGGIIEMTEAVTGTNRAFEAMAIQMDTLQGSFDKFKNAEEALQISIAKEFEPTLRSLVDTGTAIVKFVNKLPSGLLAVGTAIGVVAAVTIGLTVALFAMQKVLIGIGILLSPIIVSFGLVAAVIGGVIVGVVGIIAAIGALKNARMERLKDDFGAIAVDTGIAVDNMKEFLNKANDVSKQLSMISSGFGEGLDTVQKLRKALQDIADVNDVTLEQAIAVGKTNELFVEQAGERLGLLEEEIAEGKRIEALNLSVRDALAEQAALRQFLIDKAKEEANTELETEANVAEVYKTLETAFKRSVEFQKLLGDEYDRNADLSGAFLKAQTALVEQGLKAEEVEIQELIRLWKEYQVEFGAVRDDDEPTDLEKRLAIQEELDIILAELIQKEILYAANGQKFDLEREQSTAVLNAANKLLAEGFTIAGGGFTKFIELFGDYIKPVEDATTTTQEYIDKLRDLAATELGLNEIERQKALILVEGNESATIAIDNYFDALAEGIKQTALDERTEQIALYQDKIDKLALSELELIEIERERALESVEGNEEAIVKVNELYDILADNARLEAFKNNFEEITDVVLDFIDAFDSLIQAVIGNLISVEEEQLTQALADIQTLEDAAIEAAGVAEETEREKLERQFLDALRAGDAQKALLIQNELDRLTIQEQYDALRIAATDDANEKIAKLQYKADLVSWAADGLAAITKSALAILEGYATGGFIGGLVMTGLAAAQLFAIGASKPKPPKFRDGGVIPGSSYKGDATSVLADAGEIILNKAGQKNVANELTNGSDGGVIHIVNNTYLDGKIVATNSAKYYRNGQVKL
jgi:TP901 family phage tail tape measure protein